MAKRKKLLKQRHTVRMFLEGLPKGSPPLEFPVPMSDATRPVTLSRKELDAYNGKPGLQMECMNAQCGLRLKDAFPHKVYMIEFADTRCFVVDRVNKQGHPTHVVRYYHHEGGEQKEFDVPGGKSRLINSGRVDKDIKLLVPTRSIRHVRNTKPRARVEVGARLTGKRKRSFARALRAGILSAA